MFFHIGTHFKKQYSVEIQTYHWCGKKPFNCV